jgi:hypothetical protein
VSRPAEIVEIDLASLVELEAHGPARLTVFHMVAAKLPWLYTLKTGEEAAYARMGGPMSMHLRNPGKLRLVPLCAEVTGRRELPFREGGFENHASRNVKLVTCIDCRVALDRALEQGRVAEKKSEWSGKFRGTLEISVPTNPAR